MRYFVFSLLIIIGTEFHLNAQVGIGASGGMIYPGFSSSEFHNSRFVVGAGFDFFVRHRLIKISTDHQLDAKYSIGKYFSDIDLARVGNTRFYFSYLSIDVQKDIKRFNKIKLTAGFGLSLVNVTGENNLYQLTESFFIPNINFAGEYSFSQYYNLFLIGNFQYGKFNTSVDNLRVHGFKLLIGATMFFTD